MMEKVAKHHHDAIEALLFLTSIASPYRYTESRHGRPATVYRYTGGIQVYREQSSIQVYRYTDGIQVYRQNLVYRQYTGIQRYTGIQVVTRWFAGKLVYRYTDIPQVFTIFIYSTALTKGGSK